jgi:glycerophosphoryl diester phosphodiesterase
LVAPENTVPAFLAALDQGADGVELDVRLTADGVPVCLHDAGLGRTTDGRGPLRERTLAQVRALDASLALGRNGANPFLGRGVRVPTLAEALDALPPDALVDVEVKARGEGERGAEAVAAVLAATLLGRADRQRVLVSSFSRRLVAAAVAALPGIRVGLVTPTFVPLGRALRAAQALECRVLAAQASAYLAPKARLAAARGRADGMLLAAWTVDDPDSARRLADLGVQVLVSDVPGRLRLALSG